MKRKKKIISTLCIALFIASVSIAGWKWGVQNWISPVNIQSSVFDLKELSRGQLVVPGTYLSVMSGVAEKLLLRLWRM